ncbi:SseB family protein [Salipiger sp. IMCC34102]|uniref:SseB family protein n=1 Tax=Salipiger sp. IMCC34102 TaxID=2510647 RepID=UPI00101BB550|nr:SseB family protein [Salipiger sp. IMCC34102]RYH02134.1 SseB family protein [Salipiger sp. IMCC34102]
MSETTLDRSHAAMEAAPGDDTLRLRFYEDLCDSDIFILLDGEPEGDTVRPATLRIEDVDYVLCFDTEDRLTAFTKREAPYASLPGRALVQMMAGQGAGLGVNLKVAPSAMLIPPDGVEWLIGTLSHAPEQTEARLVGISRPTGLPESVFDALDRKLSKTAGLAETAWLVAAEYEDGAKGHVLGFVGAEESAQAALAHAAGEALTFSGIDAGVMDVVFVGAGDEMAKRLERVGLRFDLPKFVRATPEVPVAPGSDPTMPPKLR